MAGWTCSDNDLIRWDGTIKARNFVVGNNLNLLGMTAGSVLFAGANGLVSQDNSNLYWDDTNNRLGIGTTTPAFKLQVRDGINNSYTSTSASLAFPNGVLSNIDNNNASDNKFSGISFTSLNGDNINALSYIGTVSSTTSYDSPLIFGRRTGALSYSESMRIDGYGLVGIGTASPAYKLDVKGPDTDNTILARFYSNSSIRGSFIIRNGVTTNPTTFIGTAGTGEKLAIGANNTEVIRITDAGNVGIGTTTPVGSLQVSGANLNTFRVSNPATSAALCVSGAYVGIGTTSPSEKLHISAGNLSLTNANSISTLQGAIKFSSPTYPDAYAGIAGITNSGGTNQVDLVFYSAYGSSSEKMRILAQSGNVGIGTTSPSTILVPHRSVSFDTTTTEAGQDNIFLATNVPSGIGNYGSSIGFSRLSDGGLARRSSISAVQGTADSDQIGIAFLTHPSNTATALVEAMRINYNGNVGIGTTSPRVKLEASGGYIGLTYGYGVQIEDSVGALKTAMYAGSTGTTLRAISTEGLSFENSTGGRLAVISNTGLMGIGTTSPDSRLSVSGALSFSNTAAPTLTSTSGALFVSGALLYYKNYVGTYLVNMTAI